uniref:Uncharacterized protein n=1 Tax=Panagrolaimus superbus TaxID=310955 RepID=A0A914XWY1_9BILA
MTESFNDSTIDIVKSVSPETWIATVPSLRYHQYFSTAETTYEPSDIFWKFHDIEPHHDQARGSQKIGCTNRYARVMKIELYEDHFVLYMTDNTIAKVPAGEFNVLGTQIRAYNTLSIDIKSEYDYDDKPKVWKAFLYTVDDLTLRGCVFPQLLTHMLNCAGGMTGIRRFNLFPKISSCYGSFNNFWITAQGNGTL